MAYHCFPSEGGHVEFAPKNALESELLAYLTVLFPARVSVERLVSGAGIAHTYDFFALKFPERVNLEFQAQVSVGTPPDVLYCALTSLCVLPVTIMYCAVTIQYCTLLYYS